MCELVTSPPNLVSTTQSCQTTLSIDYGIQTWLSQIGHTYGGWLRTPAPVENGGLSHYLKAFNHPFGVGFRNHPQDPHPIHAPQSSSPEPGLPPLQPMPAGSLEGVVVVVPPFSEGQDAHLRLSSRVRKGPRAHTQRYIYMCVYLLNFIYIYLLLFDCLLIYLVSIFWFVCYLFI